jgi:hypothetical protein
MQIIPCQRSQHGDIGLVTACMRRQLAWTTHGWGMRPHNESNALTVMFRRFQDNAFKAEMWSKSLIPMTLG